jgi:hypothetical protein
MISKRSQYISLVNQDESKADSAEVKYIPEVRTIQLSGKRWGWVWNHPRGIVVQKGEDRKRVPIIDFTRVIQAVIYGISFLLILVGLHKKSTGSGGNAHG